MGVDPQKKVEGTPPSLHSLPLEVPPLNPARKSGECCISSRSGVWGGAPAEIELGAF